MSFFSGFFMTNKYIFVTIIIGDTMKNILNDTNKVRKLTYFLLCFGFIFLISGSFSSFLTGLRTDHQEVMRRMEDVSGVFESFSTNTTVFEEFRDELYNDVLGNVFYDTMYATDASVKEKLKEYEGIVDTLEEDAKKLDTLCGSNVYYPEGDINSKCDNYKSIYEQVINFFVTDIDTYNENVQKYNEYQKAIQSELLVEDYFTKRNYIDYNGDKVFDGKEE